MSITQQTLQLAEYAFGGLFYFGWVSISILALIVALGWFQRNEIKGVKKNVFWLFLPLLGVTATLLAGALLKQMEEFGWVGYTGLIITVLLGCTTVIKIPKAKFFAASIAAFICWCGFWCSFVSTMSITDRWL